MEHNSLQKHGSSTVKPSESVIACPSTPTYLIWTYILLLCVFISVSLVSVTEMVIYCTPVPSTQVLGSWKLSMCISKWTAICHNPMSCGSQNSFLAYKDAFHWCCHLYIACQFLYQCAAAVVLVQRSPWVMMCNVLWQINRQPYEDRDYE